MPDEIIVGRTGDLRAVYSPATDAVLRGVAAKGGELETRRASHVEPSRELSLFAILYILDQKIDTNEPPPVREDLLQYIPSEKWWADCIPVGGPVLGPYETREEALDAEAVWLRENKIPVCEPCRQQVHTPPVDPLDDDRDPHNPVEMTSEQWGKFYNRMDDYEGYLDNDTSMNG